MLSKIRILSLTEDEVLFTEDEEDVRRSSTRGVDLPDHVFLEPGLSLLIDQASLEMPSPASLLRLLVNTVVSLAMQSVVGILAQYASWRELLLLLLPPGSDEQIDEQIESVSLSEHMLERHFPSERQSLLAPTRMTAALDPVTDHGLVLDFE